MKKDFKSIPIEHAVWREMQQEKVDSGMEVYKIVGAAWRYYHSRPASLRETPGSIAHSVPAELQVEKAGKRDLWVETLREILDSGHATAIPAIQQNLMAFFELVQTAKGEKADGIRAHFSAAFKATRKTAAELRRDGERPGGSKKDAPIGRGKAG